MAVMTGIAHSNGSDTDGNTDRDTEQHELDDMDAALLQSLIAKRVINLDSALEILAILADATGILSCERNVM